MISKQREMVIVIELTAQPRTHVPAVTRGRELCILAHDDEELAGHFDAELVGGWGDGDEGEVGFAVAAVVRGGGDGVGQAQGEDGGGEEELHCGECCCCLCGRRVRRERQS